MAVVLGVLAAASLVPPVRALVAPAIRSTRGRSRGQILGAGAGMAVIAAGTGSVRVVPSCRLGG